MVGHRAHQPLPRLPHALGDRRLGAVIHDHRQVRMAIQHRQQCRQLRGPHERVEAQPQPGQGRQRAADLGAQDPRRVGQVLQHRPHALQQRVARQSRQRGNGLGGAQVGPAHDTFDDAAAVPRDIEQIPRLGDGGGRLHEHRRRDVRLLAQRLHVGQRKVAVDRRQRRREPAVVAARERPHVVMGVDESGHRDAGNGASAAMRPRSRNSAQSAGGIACRISATSVSNSAHERAPPSASGERANAARSEGVNATRFPPVPSTVPRRRPLAQSRSLVAR